MTDSAQKAPILIVDDSPEQLKLLMGLLKEEYQILAAKSGPKALELLAANPLVRVVLLDVNMPEMDGFEVCKRIQDQSAGHTQVVFVSGNDSAEEVMRGFKLGAADYLTKPVRPIILKNKIAQLLAEPPAVEPDQYNEKQAVPTGIDALAITERTQEGCESLIRLQNPERLPELMVDLLQHLGLKDVVIASESAGTVGFNSSKSHVIPLERELLQRLLPVQRMPAWQHDMLVASMPGLAVLARSADQGESAQASLQEALTLIMESVQVLYQNLPKNAVTEPAPAQQALQQLEAFSASIDQFLQQAHLTLQQEEHLQRIVQSHLETMRRHFE